MTVNEKLIDDATLAFTDRELTPPSKDDLRIALESFEASMTRCGCEACTIERRRRIALTDHDRTALARALHEIVYSPGANYERAVPGIQEHMLACAEKVAAALPWLMPHTPTDDEVRISAFGPIGSEPALSIEEGWVRDMQEICAAAQCSTPGVTRGPTSYAEVGEDAAKRLGIKPGRYIWGPTGTIGPVPTDPSEWAKLPTLPRPDWLGAEAHNPTDDERKAPTLPDDEIDDQGNEANRKNDATRPQLGGLLPSPIGLSDLDGADGPGAVLGSRAPVVVLAHGASSLAADTSRTTPDRTGDVR